MKSLADAKSRATALQLHGLLAHWPDCAEAPWLETLLSWEETERARRSLERRLRCAHTLITTNKAFSEWSEVFPNASCVVAMIDRLVHHAEIIPIELLDDLRNRIIGKQRQRLARCRFALDRLAHHNQATRRRPAGCLVTKFRQFHSAFQRPPAAGLVDRPL